MSNLGLTRFPEVCVYYLVVFQILFVSDHKASDCSLETTSKQASICLMYCIMPDVSCSCPD